MRYFLVSLLLISMFTTTHAKSSSDKMEDLRIRADQFIKVMNSAEPKQIGQFIDQYFAKQALERWGGAGRERYLGYTQNMAIRHGKFTVLAEEEQNTQERLRVTHHVHSPNTDLQYSIVINFDTQAPHGITNWYITPNYQKFKNQTDLTEQKLVSELAKLTHSLAKSGYFSGTVLLAKGDKILFQEAHGLASRRYDVANNLDTKFQIGSINKMFTGVAIMQLVQAGKLSLNDKLTQYMDRSLFGDGQFDAITIEQLLTHTSGLGGIPGFQEKQSHIRSLNDTLTLYKDIELDFEPGTQWRYSSSGIRMLGHVIEAVTQQSYYDVIASQIYNKAGMGHSGSFDLDVPVKNTARSYWYSVDTNRITENLMMQGVKGDPAGGGFSTVGDLHKFALALNNKQLLNTATMQLATSAKPELNSPNYGFGFSVRGAEGNQIIGHNGAHLGMSAQLNIYRDKGYILAVLGNTGDGTRPIVFAMNELMTQL